NKPATKIPDEGLIADVQNFPDDYQWERAKRLGVSQSAIHYALKRLRITQKKNAPTPSR
uniref:IS630 transposase-related protein n=1 Tax=Xenorhabdus vietnamensis TaxID=351656 RepID=UPI001FCA2CB5